MTDFPQNVTKYNDKTILRIEEFETFLVIYFTDGSSVEIQARGTEEQWISIDDIHY